MIGTAALLAILWELMKCVALIRWSPELATAYTDTLLDETMDLAGAVLATPLLVGPFWPGDDSAPEPHKPG